MNNKELEKKIRAIIFDDEFDILGKVKFKNDVAVGPQIEQFKVDSLIALIDNEIIGEDDDSDTDEDTSPGEILKIMHFENTRNNLRKEQREKLRA